MRPQQKVVLNALRAAGPAGVDTEQFRTMLNIPHPAGRVYELRGTGRFDIQTVFRGTDRQRFARYVLVNESA